ncbi:YceI family protein [Flavobacterium soyangense]|uniref:YceI family protein n=1 Tax=Flavobacterium soyangense TaxID=2023265 RepID=A0A930U672_9FLAO|nr:YceI family protein [Flavobacterium soyangense]MBF2707633.1 YceI family protein [Flavobacterium soyangense]
MKKIILLFSLLLFNTVIAQKKMFTNKGIIIFDASVPLFEEIKAKNESVTCILNTNTGEIASLVLMRGFRFKIALMEEHFNENYIESDKYPKATFEGIIQGFNINIIGTSPKEFKMNGKLELHGKSKEINTTVKLRKVNEALEIIADFDVNTDDFNIEIPQILTKKLSKTVNIKTNFLVK